MGRRGAHTVAIGALALIVAAGIVVPHLLAPKGTNAVGTDAPVVVTAGTDVCGDGWGAGTSSAATGIAAGGTTTFRIRNTSIAGVEVQLEDPRSGAVYLDAEGLGAGASQDYRVRLANGSYRFRCLPADSATITGRTIRVTDAAHVSEPTPGIVPVTRNDLIPAAQSYGAWIQGRLPTLEADVTALADDLHAGDVPAAERDWLTGHTEYEQLGAAYGAFGDDDTVIDGIPASGTTALDDPDLTGFHRVEALLWSGAPAADIAPAADALVAAVQHLEQTFPTARIDPLDIGLRAHEILENALRFEATGETDAGSHTNLATIAANVRGTDEALVPIRGLLTTRYRDLGKTDAALTDLASLVDTYEHADGTWTPIDELDTTAREQLNARLDDAIERLAPIAAICDIRRTS